MKLLFSLLLLAGILPTFAQNVDSVYMHTHYDLTEVQIPMRDGIKLFAIVYTPKDQSQKHPILLNRTCYNASNYSNYKTGGYPSPYLIKDKYILVYQDVRGRYMSEGMFDNMRPNIPGNDRKNKKAIDESSDTGYHWLVNQESEKQ